MSAADHAYAAAVARIKWVIADRRKILDFSNDRFVELERIPPEISRVEGLLILDLSSTRVADLAPLAGLAGLQTLWLDNTNVSDLKPLARLTALQTLGLDNTEVSNLTPLSGLTALQWLRVRGTSVTDLTPIAGLTGLERLWLDGTQVSDLRPLIGLREIKVKPLEALDFAETPFACATVETRRLAAIENRELRTRETLAFLTTLPLWPEALPWEMVGIEAAAVDGTPVVTPDQDPALRLIWGERGFGFLVDHIGIDPATQEVLAELRDLLDTLIRQSGNSHEDVHRLATEMRGRCEPEGGRLNAMRLHLSLQRLERLFAGRDRRERLLDDEIVSTIEGIVLVAPGATLADLQVQEIIRRQDANRAAPLSPTDGARADAVLDAIAAPEAPFAPEVQEFAGVIRGGGPDDRLTASRGILAGNAVVAVGRMLKRILSSPGEMVASVALIGWARGNAGLIEAYALSMGSDAAIWITRILTELGKVAPPL